MDSKETHDCAEKLVKEAEAQRDVSKQLNKLSIEERLGVAREMRDISARHHQMNKDLPVVEIYTNTDAGRREHLTDIEVRFERNTFSPLRLIYGDYSRVDVYDPPASETGCGLLNQACDGILDQKMKLDQVYQMLESQQKMMGNQVKRMHDF